MNDLILHPGFRLNNKYTIKSLLGEPGGFGVVFKAIEDITGKEVAIKEFFEKADIFEFQALAKLKHAHIVEYITHEYCNDTLFMVMDYAPGGNLDSIIRSNGFLPENTALAILKQIAAAVAYAHQHGIVHRDIKPLNILYYNNATYKLADFGIARFLDKTRSNTEGRHSIPYAAPELFDGQFGKKTDVYALGITFYEMLTGTPPFIGRTEFEIYKKILDMDIKPAMPVGISKVTTDIIMGCLNKKIDERWDIYKLVNVLLAISTDHESNNVYYHDVHLNKKVGIYTKADLSSKEPGASVNSENEREILRQLQILLG